jgi:hypothetical protein
MPVNDKIHDYDELGSSKKIPGRAVIYVRDIQNITGRSSSSASRYLQAIREFFGKKREQWVTIYEFCEFSGMKLELVRRYIN